MNLKKITILIVMLASVCLLCSCEQSEKTSQGDTKIPSGLDRVYCTLKNANYTFYNDLTCARMVTFNLLSPNKLDEEDVKINIDTEMDFSYSMEEVKNEEFPYVVFQSYNGVDWEKMKKLYVSYETEEYNKYSDSWLVDYEKIDKSSIPEVYNYVVTIGFELKESMKDEEINKIEIVCNGKPKTYDIGSIKLKENSKVKIKAKGISMDTIAVSDYRICPDDEGKLPLSDQFIFTVEENITLKKIETVLENDTIQDISLDVENNGNSINQKWDGKSDFPIKKDSKVVIYGNIIDENYKNSDLYSTIKYIMITYELNGKIYSEKMEYSYVTELNKYEYVAMLHDGVNISSYYYDFLKHVK